MFNSILSVQEKNRIICCHLILVLNQSRAMQSLKKILRRLYPLTSSLGGVPPQSPSQLCWCLLCSQMSDQVLFPYLQHLTSLEKREVEPVGPVLKNIYQSNTYRIDLSWPHFENEPRVQEKEQVKDQQSCIFVVVACLTIPGSN